MAESKYGTNFFIAVLEYLVPYEQISIHRPKHLEFLKKYYDQKIFITSGPQVPKTGGIIMARCETKDQFDNILKEDPYFINKLASYKTYEFVPNENSILNFEL